MPPNFTELIDFVSAFSSVAFLIGMFGLLLSFHKYKRMTIERQAKFEQRVDDKLDSLCKFQKDFEKLDIVTKADCINCPQSAKTKGLESWVIKIEGRLQGLEVSLAGFMGRTEKQMELTEKVLSKLDKRADIKTLK